VIKPPSLVHEYDLIYSGDPALALPEDEKEREHALTTARETGNWQALLIAGQEPTLFTLRPLTVDEYEWWGTLAQGMTVARSAMLALRLALRKVQNFGAFKVEPTTEDGYRMAKKEIVDALLAVKDGTGAVIGMSLVVELAGVVVDRARSAPSPKS
jgi:hypothetical protein